MRTSSRSGYLDYGANAKRYNWLAKEACPNPNPNPNSNPNPNPNPDPNPNPNPNFNPNPNQVGKSKGWKITPIRQKEHPGYFEQNDITDADV